MKNNLVFFSSGTSHKQQVDPCNHILTAFWNVCVVTAFVKVVLVMLRCRLTGINILK